MTKLKARLLSLPSLILFSLIGAGLSVALIFPVSRFITTHSVSIEDNFRTVALFMGLLLVASAAQMLLIARVIWGRNAFSDNETERSVPESGAADEAPLAMPNLGVTGAKLSFIYILVMLVNTVVFDQVGRGTLLSDTRRWGVLTGLRSTDGATRRAASEDAVHFPGDREMTRALSRILDGRGASREWAALAAGARIDKELGDSLIALAETGTPVERAAAIGALARTKDSRLVRGVLGAWPHLGKYRADAFLALAIVGKNEDVLTRKDMEDAGNFIMDTVDSKKLDSELTRLAIFALNRLESPLGLVWLEGLLTTEKDVQTLCMALEALGNIGAADSSPKMIAFFDAVDPKGRCEEGVALDFAGRQTLIRSKADIQARALAEIAHIGDSRALKDMVRISKDTRIAQTVRNMAAEIAFQLQFRAGGSL